MKLLTWRFLLAKSAHSYCSLSEAGGGGRYTVDVYVIIVITATFSRQGVRSAQQLAACEGCGALVQQKRTDKVAPLWMLTDVSHISHCSCATVLTIMMCTI